MNSWVWKPMGQVVLRALLPPVFFVTNPRIDYTEEAGYTFMILNP